MARKPRNVIAGYPFLIFADDEDRRRFRVIVQGACLTYGVAVHAYVLMEAHFQIVATPEQPDGLALLMQAIGRQYVRGFNRRHDRTGTLWEGRFRASLIQAPPYLLSCQRYLEAGPVRAGLVGRPEQFAWSSHRHHLGLVTDPLVSTHTQFWALGNTPFEREAAYRRLFESPGTDRDAWVAARIERGHPVAGKEFLDELEARTGRAWHARSVGRPAKPVAPGVTEMVTGRGGRDLTRPH
jgi:putative transposase